MAQSPAPLQTVSQGKQGSECKMASPFLVWKDHKAFFPGQISGSSSQLLPTWLIWISAGWLGGHGQGCSLIGLWAKAIILQKA